MGYIEDSFYNQQILNKSKFNYETELIIEFDHFINLVRKIRFEVGKTKSILKLVIISSKKIKWIEDNIFLINSIFNFSKIEYLKSYKAKDHKVIVISGIKFILEIN